VPDLRLRRLYLCVGWRDDMAQFLTSVVRAGVDVVQLREKVLPLDAQREMAAIMAPICREFGVPFIINDSPHLALEVGADGVHVGQDDLRVATCRDILGPEAVIGLSTHSTDEFDRALVQDADYFSAGPVVPTPTKPGRAGTGAGYAAACQARSDRPVFVTGGVDASNVEALVGAGVRHFVVVRALTEAVDPARSAAQLREAIDRALSAVPVQPT